MSPPRHGPYRTLADVVDRTELPEETIQRLIRAGALDSLGRPRRELLWQLREVMGATRTTGPAAGGRTVTGRPSSRSPNLNNIPRTSTAAAIKDLFIADPGCWLIEVDEAQAEFRYWINESKDRLFSELCRV